MPWYSCYP